MNCFFPRALVSRPADPTVPIAICELGKDASANPLIIIQPLTYIKKSGKVFLEAKLCI
jgi:hypothetical protein